MQFRRVRRIDDGTLFPKGHTLLYIHANASWFLQSSLWIRWAVCQPIRENKGWYIINEDWSQKAYWPHLHRFLTFLQKRRTSFPWRKIWLITFTELYLPNRAKKHCVIDPSLFYQDWRMKVSEKVLEGFENIDSK